MYIFAWILTVGYAVQVTILFEFGLKSLYEWL